MLFVTKFISTFNFQQGESPDAYQGILGCVWEGAGRLMKPIMPDKVGRHDSAARSIQRPAVSSIIPDC